MVWRSKNSGLIVYAFLGCQCKYFFGNLIIDANKLTIVLKNLRGVWFKIYIKLLQRI